MTRGKSFVTIKGTKDGLTFLLDDRCSFDELIKELTDKLSANYYKSGEEDRPVYVKMDLGNRYLNEEDKAQLEAVVTEGRNMRIEHYDSGVISWEEAQLMKEHAQTTTLTRMIRSGQVVHVKGNVLLVGDINPGGLLTATGSIYVMGALKGRAHAGFEGKRDARICAAMMAPAGLQIADESLYFVDKDEAVENHMKAAFLDEANGNIRIERVQRLLDVAAEINKEAVS
ncbi:septum site-determining protein MinC [Shouchella clausii]|uniref:septum site-determining protein MinC n=1 Tax=Shouchella clausii TaxID=79880 RepID=UPI003983D67D